MGERIEVSFRHSKRMGASGDLESSMDVVDYLLADSGAHVRLNIDEGNVLVSMPALEPSAMLIHARWEAASA